MQNAEWKAWSAGGVFDTNSTKRHELIKLRHVTHARDYADNADDGHKKARRSRKGFGSGRLSAIAKETGGA
jgi:hypothetical protein